MVRTGSKQTYITRYYKSTKMKRKYSGYSGYGSKRRAVGRYRRVRRRVPYGSLRRRFVRRKRTFSKRARVQRSVRRKLHKTVKYVAYRRFDTVLDDNGLNTGRLHFLAANHCWDTTADSNLIFSKNDLAAHARLYDKFRIVKQTYTFWILNDINDDGVADRQTEMYSVYDDDGAGNRTYDSAAAFMRTPQAKHKFLKVGKKYKITHYPRWLKNFSSSSVLDIDRFFMRDDKENMWFDAGVMYTTTPAHAFDKIPPPINTTAYMIIGTRGMKMTWEVRTHFLFKHKTNGAG